MSQKLDLDFIQSRPFMLSTFTWFGLSLFVAGVVLLIFTLQYYQAMLITHTEVVLKLDRLNQQYQQKTPVNTASADISPETKIQIEATVTALTIPWNALLVAIEKSDMQDVALLSLEPSIKKQQVLLSGEAKNLQSILKYIHRLEEQSMLAQVYLQKHSVDEASSEKPVRFTLTAQWHKEV